MALVAAVATVAASTFAHAQRVVVIDNATVDVQVVQGPGRVAACGIRVKAPFAAGLQALRIWDITLYLAATGKSTGIAVEASSYDVASAGAKADMRPAPTDIAFTIQGNLKVFTATAIRPSQTQGASLALIADKGAGQILTAMEAGTPVTVFFRPQDSDTEVVTVSGRMKPHGADAFGQCIQAMQGH
jgi:hypothetical protein